MAERIDPNRFYRDGRGGAPDRGLENEAFFRSEVHEERPRFADLPSTPSKHGALLALAGFAAVFLDQAPFLYQLVLGAPIFEELFKFGLALIATAALPRLWARLPAALLIGAGFGVMEHFVSYSAEPTSVLVGRIAFHGLSTGLTMVVYEAVRRRSVHDLWWAPVPSIFIHYLNNAGAIVLGVPLELVGLGAWSFIWSGGLVLALLVLTIVWLARPAAPQRLCAWLTRKITPSLRDAG